MQIATTSKLKISNEFPLYLMLFGMMAILIATPLRVNAIMSMGTWIIVGASLFAFAVSLVQKKLDTWYLLVILLLLGTIVLSIAYSFEISYSNLVVAGCFLEIPFFLGAYPSINRVHLRNTIYGCFVILSVYYLLLSFTSLAYLYRTKYGVVQMPYMTLGYNNPNETAMLLFVCLIVLVSLSARTTKKPVFLLLLVDCVSVIFLLWRTLSRTGLVLSVAFLVLVLAYRKKESPSWLRIVSFIIPIGFLFVTLFFDEVLSTIQMFGDTVDTGRNTIYSAVLENMNAVHFLIGDFTIRFENLHNGFWCIFATIGLIGVMMYAFFLFKKMKETQMLCNQESTDKVAFIGLCCILIYTATEAAYLSAGSVFAALVVSVYALAVTREEEETPE